MPSSPPPRTADALVQQRIGEAQALSARMRESAAKLKSACGSPPRPEERGQRPSPPQPAEPATAARVAAQPEPEPEPEPELELDELEPEPEPEEADRFGTLAGMDDELQKLGLGRSPRPTSPTSGRIFGRLQDDTFRRRLEAEHRDLTRDEAHRQKALAKKQALKLARQEFEASSSAPDPAAEVASWRGRISAEESVITGSLAKSMVVETPEPTVPERDGFMDRMHGDISQRRKDGRGIHSMTEQAPHSADMEMALVAGTLRWRKRALATSPRQRAVQSSRRLKSPKAPKRPMSPTVTTAAVALQRAQRGISERQRLQQDLATETEELESMVLRGEGDASDYERLLQLHRWGKHQHNKPRPQSPPEPYSPPQKPKLKPFLPADRGASHNVTHLSPQENEVKSPPRPTPSQQARSPVVRGRSPVNIRGTGDYLSRKPKPTSPPQPAAAVQNDEGAVSPMTDHSRRRAPQSFAVLQHDNAEHHEHHEISAASVHHAVHRVGEKHNETALLSYRSAGNHQDEDDPPPAVSPRPQLQLVKKTSATDMPKRFEPQNPDSRTPLQPRWAALEPEPEPEPESDDETDTESEPDETSETILFEGQVHLTVASQQSRWILVDLQLVRRHLDHWTAEDELRWRPAAAAPSPGSDADVAAEGDAAAGGEEAAEQADWITRTLSTVRLWREPGMTGHPLPPPPKQLYVRVAGERRAVQHDNDNQDKDAGRVRLSKRQQRLERERDLEAREKQAAKLRAAGHSFSELELRSMLGQPEDDAMSMSAMSGEGSQRPSVSGSGVSTVFHTAQSFGGSNESVVAALHDLYGYTFCVGQESRPPAATAAASSAGGGSAGARSPPRRRWSQAGAESRVVAKVEIDLSACAPGVPAAAHEALEQLYRHLSSKTAVVNAFKTIDAGVGTWRKGGPGALRAPELRKALALLNVPLNEVQISHVIAAIDTDGDGEVDVKEFIHFVWKGRTDLLRRKLDTAAYTFGGRDYVKLFNHYDRDNSGTLDWDEFRRAVRKDVKVAVGEVPDNELKELFDGVDDDGSGEVDCEEFVMLLQPVAAQAAAALQSGGGAGAGLSLQLGGESEDADQQLSAMARGASMSMSVAGAQEARRLADISAAEKRLGTVSGKILSLVLDHATARRMNVLRLFHRFDSDGSGELDSEEIAVAMSVLGIVISEADMAQLLIEMDGDGGETISIAEFWRTVRQCKKDRYTLTARDSQLERASIALDRAEDLADEAAAEEESGRVGVTGIGESPRGRDDRRTTRYIYDRQLQRMIADPSGDEDEDGRSSVWVISCAKASQQRAWLSAIGEALATNADTFDQDDSAVPAAAVGPTGGASMVEGSLQEGMKEIAARRVQAGTRGMLVRHTPEVRLQVALRRAQLRDHELLRKPGDPPESEESEEEPEDPEKFIYTGPEGPEIKRLRQNLRAASFGKGEKYGHGQDVKTLFERYDTDNNGTLGRADFGTMLSRGGKASLVSSAVNRTSSLRVSDIRPGHASSLTLTEVQVDEIYAALDPYDMGGVCLANLEEFVWVTEERAQGFDSKDLRGRYQVGGGGAGWRAVRGAVRGE